MRHQQYFWSDGTWTTATCCQSPVRHVAGKAKVRKDCAMRYATGETAHQGAKLHMALMKARTLREEIKEFIKIITIHYSKWCRYCG